MFKRTLIAVSLLAVSSAHAEDRLESATLQYRSSMGIPATMSFKRTNDSYTIVADIHVPKYKIRFESGGSIVGGFFKPQYYNDIRNGKLYASAKMAHGQVLLGKEGDKHVERATGSVMDLFTVAWQIAYSEGKLPADLHITNGKKMYRVSSLKPMGVKSITVNGVKTDVVQYSLKREDSTVQYGFAPDLGNIPAIIGYNDDGKRYNLTLKSAVINGVSVKPNKQQP